MIGTQILITAELLIEALDVRSTERVLDAATGSGNAALAAARRGCDVVAAGDDGRPSPCVTSPCGCFRPLSERGPTLRLGHRIDPHAPPSVATSDVWHEDRQGVAGT